MTDRFPGRSGRADEEKERKLANFQEAQEVEQWLRQLTRSLAVEGLGACKVGGSGRFCFGRLGGCFVFRAFMLYFYSLFGSALPNHLGVFDFGYLGAWAAWDDFVSPLNRFIFLNCCLLLVSTQINCQVKQVRKNS